MDRRTLIAITLGILFFIGWQKFYIEPKYGKPGQTQTQVVAPITTNSSSGTITSSNATGAIQSAVGQPPKEITSTPLTVDGAVAQIGNGGKFFTDWTVEGYKESTAKDAQAVSAKQIFQHPQGMGEMAFDLKEYAYLNNVGGTVTQNGDQVLWSYEDANVRMTREFTRVPGQKYLLMKVAGEFKAKRPNFIYLSLGSDGHKDDPEKQDRQLLYHTNKDLKRLHAGKLDPVEQYAGPIDWMATQSRYFLMTFVPTAKAPRGMAENFTEESSKLSLIYPIESDRFEIPMKVYFGPKEINSLKAVEPSLDLTIDLGFFTFFAYWILRFLKWIHTFVPNWGLAIIVLTICIKLLTFPLTYKSMKSMKKMAALQPKMNALRERLKDDKEALNRELMMFMKNEGYNPISGCLPMIIQMPVFFALWRVLYSSIELYQAPFFGWIHDLSVKDPFYVTPIALTAFMFFQQKLTPSTATDPMQAKMLQWMPVIFGFMMLNLPAGLTVYMLTNAIASIVQQLILNRKLGNVGPTVAEPEVLPAQ